MLAAQMIQFSREGEAWAIYPGFLTAVCGDGVVTVYGLCDWEKQTFTKEEFIKVFSNYWFSRRLE